MGVRDQQSEFNGWYENSEQLQIDQALFNEWSERVYGRSEKLGIHFDQSYQDQANAAAARLNAIKEYQAAQTQKTERDAERQRLTQEFNPTVADMNEGLRKSEEASKQNELQKYQNQEVYKEVQRLTQEFNHSDEGLYKGAETAINTDIVVYAELVKNPDGELLAVVNSPDLSLRQKLADFSQTFRTLEKSPVDVTLDQIRSGIITTSDFLDVRKYMLPLAAQTLMNSDVLMTGLLYNFKSKNTAGLEQSKSTKELAQTERVAARSPSERPSWRQSEKDVGNANPQYQAQTSFKDSQEVPYGTKGSVRPDYYQPGSTIEVKNYDISTISGRTRLVDNISGQLVQRYENLPQGTGQKIVIDVRGQNTTNDVLRDIRDSIVNRADGNVEIEFLR